MNTRVVLLSLVVLVVAVAASATSSSSSSSSSSSWQPVVAAMEAWRARRAYPGAVAVVGDRSGVLFAHAVGALTYGTPPPQTPSRVPPTTVDTFFDMASCSKILATTTAAAQLYQRGVLALDTRIAAVLGDDYAAHGKGNVTVLNCLLHNAGYPPDPVPNYWAPEFGCPATAARHPPQTFDCQQRIFDALLAQTLENPVGARYVYSDLSMITMQYVIGEVARRERLIVAADCLPSCLAGDGGGSDARWHATCYFEAYVRRYVWNDARGPLDGVTYRLDASLWPRAAPAWNDTSYRHEVIQGTVSDGNSYALGGIAGHAGVFAQALPVARFMSYWMWPGTPSVPVGDTWLNATTRALFVREFNHSQSSRALGWNTNDPSVHDQGWGLSCGNMSAATFMHDGYTGTMICGDPVNDYYFVLLTNRVYPATSNTQIHDARQAVSDAALAVVKQLRARGLIALPAHDDDDDNNNNNADNNNDADNNDDADIDNDDTRRPSPRRHDRRHRHRHTVDDERRSLPLL